MYPGRSKTARVQGSITCIKLCGLAAFALAGVSIGWRNSANLADLRPVDAKLALTLMSSMVYIYYAYTGWNSAAYLAGEIRDAQRIVPWAILLGTVLVMSLYLAPERCLCACAYQQPMFERSFLIRRITPAAKLSHPLHRSPRRDYSGRDGRRFFRSLSD